jgi:hypothetical protein
LAQEFEPESVLLGDHQLAVQRSFRSTVNAGSTTRERRSQIADRD